MDTLLLLASLAVGASPCDESCSCQVKETAKQTSTQSDADAQAALHLATARRISELEKRVAALESSKPVPPAPVAVKQNIDGHTHTCANGHTWDHSVTSSHNCPICGLSQHIQDVVPRAVNVHTQKQSSVSQTFTSTAQSAPRTVQLSPNVSSSMKYSFYQESSSCVGPNCGKQTIEKSNERVPLFTPFNGRFR